MITYRLVYFRFVWHGELGKNAVVNCQFSVNIFLTRTEYRQSSVRNGQKREIQDVDPVDITVCILLYISPHN